MVGSPHGLVSPLGLVLSPLKLKTDTHTHLLKIREKRESVCLFSLFFSIISVVVGFS